MTQASQGHFLVLSLVLASALFLLPVAALGQITYVASGTGCGVTATTCSPGIPAGTAQDDILIAVLHSRTNTPHTCTTNCTGWTEFSTQAGTTTNGQLSVWWFRRGASAPAAPTFGGPATESYAGRIFAFRGVVASGNPYDVVGPNTAQAAATPWTGTDLTTTVANAMVVFVGGSMDNNGWGPAGGTTGGGMLPSSADANFYVANNQGSDNSVFLAYDGTPNSAVGAQGAPTNTQANLGPDAGRWFTFALAPPKTITIGNGPERPAASTTGPAATDRVMEQFTLTASSGTANVTQIQVTVGGTGASRVSTVKLYRDAGTFGQLDGETPLGSVAPSGGIATFTGLSESVGTSAVRYLVAYSYSGGANGETLTADATGATASGYTTTDSSSASNAITIDANPPALITNFTATSGQDAQVPLAWTNPTDTALAEVVVMRMTGGYPTGHTDGTQVYQNLSPTSGGSVNSTDTTGPPVNGTTYYYAVYSRDSYNNWNDTTTPGSNAATATPQAGVPTLTIGNGPERPAASTTGSNATDKLVEQFTLTANTGTATLTQVVITLGGTGASRVSTVKLYRDAGTFGQLDGETPLGTASPSGGVGTFSGLSESVGISAVRYLVTYSYSGGANGETLTADATGATASGYTTTDSSSASNAITIDAAAPALITNFTATSNQDSQVPLAWTNPTDAALGEVVVMRKTGSYPTGHTDGTQVYQNLSPASGGNVNTTDTTGPPVNGTTYYYAVYSRDSDGNWNETTTPGSNAATATPQLTVTVTLSASSVSPASIAQTETNAFLKFSVTTSTGTSTLTSLTVNKLGTIADTDVQWVGLWRSADQTFGGDTMIASRPFSGGAVTFTGLNESISTSVTNWYFATVTLASAADTSKTVGLRIPANGFTVSTGTPSNSQTDSGTATITTKGGASGTGATVAILNPRDGGLVTDSVKVQVLVWVPGGLGTLTSLSLSTNGGDTYGISFNLANQPTGDRNTNYNYGNNSAVYEKTLSLTDGTYALKAQAITGGPTATSRTVTVSAMAGRGDGNLLVRDNSSVLCMDCHALAPHSSQYTSTTYGNWEWVCRDCHTPHNTENIFLIKESINTKSINNPTGGPLAVQFTNRTGDASGSYASSSATPPPYNICQVCHTQTRKPGTSTARWRNTGNADTHFTVGAGTQRCTTCHQHSLGFRPESPGNIMCTDCHSKQWTPMNSSTTTYHMYMQNADVTALIGGLGPSQQYPSDAQLAAGEEESQHRRCLMCHADMDVYSPSNNPSTPGRAYNLRTSIFTASDKSACTSPSPTTCTNTDFNSAEGGICMSCHTSVQTKNTTKQKDDGTTRTPAWDVSQFSGSAHNYTVSSTLRDNSTFNANCVKCHNDTLTKDFQTSTYTFGLHDSPYRRMLSPLGISSPADPLEEQFCTQCHSGGVAGNDYYGVASMTAKARSIAGLFSATRKHPIASTSGTHKPEERETATAGWNWGANRHVECEDCHNPHAAKAGTHTPGSNLAGNALTGIWGVSITGYTTPTVINQQDNLQALSDSNFNRIGSVTYESELCLKCHSYYAWTTNTRPNVPSGNADGSAAQVTDQAAEFNPNNLAHHAIMGVGKNQPIRVGQASYYNTNWPAFTTGTVTTSGTAVTFSSAIPSTVIPGWYLYIGATAPAQGATGWYQIASVTDSTHVTLTTSAGTQTNVAFRLTAGLGNNFVPPYGPWSTLTCSDCHGSNVSTDPSGPHGSAARWILKEADLGLSFSWWNGTSVITVTPNSVAVGGNTSTSATPAVFCFNCHRRDVYGDENLNGATATYGSYARVSHDPTGNSNTFDSANVNKWGIVCMNCHGGGGLGVIHGTNAGKGFLKDGTTAITAANSFRGKRFLYGATWTGVARATTTTAVSCWTKNFTDSVNVCKQGHNPQTGNTANYDYESGTD